MFYVLYDVALCITYVCQGHWLDQERSADDWGWR